VESALKQVQDKLMDPMVWVGIGILVYHVVFVCMFAHRTFRRLALVLIASAVFLPDVFVLQVMMVFLTWARPIGVYQRFETGWTIVLFFYMNIALWENYQVLTSVTGLLWVAHLLVNSAWYMFGLRRWTLKRFGQQLPEGPEFENSPSAFLVLGFMVVWFSAHLVLRTWTVLLWSSAVIPIYLLVRLFYVLWCGPYSLTHVVKATADNPRGISSKGVFTYRGITGLGFVDSWFNQWFGIGYWDPVEWQAEQIEKLKAQWRRDYEVKIAAVNAARIRPRADSSGRTAHPEMRRRSSVLRAEVPYVYDEVVQSTPQVGAMSNLDTLTRTPGGALIDTVDFMQSIGAVDFDVREDGDRRGLGYPGSVEEVRHGLNDLLGEPSESTRPTPSRHFDERTHFEMQSEIAQDSQDGRAAYDARVKEDEIPAREGSRKLSQSPERPMPHHPCFSSGDLYSIVQLRNQDGAHAGTASMIEGEIITIDHNVDHLLSIGQSVWATLPMFPKVPMTELIRMSDYGKLRRFQIPQIFLQDSTGQSRGIRQKRWCDEPIDSNGFCYILGIPDRHPTGHPGEILGSAGKYSNINPTAKDMDPRNYCHDCWTDHGSSGAPVQKVEPGGAVTNRVFGVHENGGPHNEFHYVGPADVEKIRHLPKVRVTDKPTQSFQNRTDVDLERKAQETVDVVFDARVDGDYRGTTRVACDAIDAVVAQPPETRIDHFSKFDGGQISASDATSQEWLRMQKMVHALQEQLVEQRQMIDRFSTQITNVPVLEHPPMLKNPPPKNKRVVTRLPAGGSGPRWAGWPISSGTWVEQDPMPQGPNYEAEPPQQEGGDRRKNKGQGRGARKQQAKQAAKARSSTWFFSKAVGKWMQYSDARREYDNLYPEEEYEPGGDWADVQSEEERERDYQNWLRTEYAPGEAPDDFAYDPRMSQRDVEDYEERKAFFRRPRVPAPRKQRIAHVPSPAQERPIPQATARAQLSDSDLRRRQTTRKIAQEAFVKLGSQSKTQEAPLPVNKVVPVQMDARVWRDLSAAQKKSYSRLSPVEQKDFMGSIAYLNLLGLQDGLKTSGGSSTVKQDQAKAGPSQPGVMPEPRSP
jgi:hypothetical protein